MSSDGGKILSVPGTAPNVGRDLLATSTVINKCIDYLVVDIPNSSGASGNQIGSPQRKEFACVVLFIITTLQPSMLCCFLCPCHELLCHPSKPCDRPAKCGPLLVLINKVLLECSPAHWFSYLLWLLPCHNGRVVATGTGWPQKLKLFSHWSFAEDAC